MVERARHPSRGWSKPASAGIAKIAFMGDLEPEIGRVRLSDEIAETRAAYNAALPGLKDTLDPRLKGHLLVLQESLDRLTELHSTLLEQTDIDLSATTRWAALWEATGRCIALANLLLAELRLGYTAETVGTIRVLEEASLLVRAFAADRSDDLVRRWLGGETLMPRHLRPILADEQDEVAAALAELGTQVEGDAVELERGIYGHLSKGAHNARPGFAESVSRPLRQFNYGPHPYPLQRAVYIDYASEALEGVILSIGSALARFLGGDWYRDTILPIQRELQAVREALPIGSEERARLGLNRAVPRSRLQVLMPAPWRCGATSAYAPCCRSRRCVPSRSRPLPGSSPLAMTPNMDSGVSDSFGSFPGALDRVRRRRANGCGAPMPFQRHRERLQRSLSRRRTASTAPNHP
jgi:hypothetical protein